MKRDEKNIIIKDIFTEQEIEDIYTTINSAPEDRIHVQKVFSHKAYFIDLPENVVNKIKLIAEENYEEPLELTEISFARYSYDMYEKGLAPVTPCLYPHRDDAFHEPRFTIDFQIKSNRSWPIIVEDREYTIKDNEALTFSGTHQVHWRPHTEWGKDDFIDLIFTHFSQKDKVPFSLKNDQKHTETMESLERHYLDLWNQDAPPGQKANC